MKVIIESVCIDDVFQYNHIRYNTNNVYHNGIRPSDYEEVRTQTETSKWIDAFKSYKLITIDLTSPRASWMKEAVNMGRHTKQFPHAFDDELDALESYLNQECCKSIFDGEEKFFVRTEDVSLKAGQHGVGPYTNIRHILESLVTCVEGHTPIRPETKEIKLYVIPWVDLRPEREYRVFVNNRKVTAISQQCCYNVFPFRDYSSDIRTILDYHNNVLISSITHIHSYCIDISILEDHTPYFIEINPFGMEYTSGSSLFGWEQDKSILYGEQSGDDENIVYFRYTTPSEFE